MPRSKGNAWDCRIAAELTLAKSRHGGLGRLVAATRFSLRGLRAAWRREAAFRQECVAALALLPCAFLLAETFTQAALLLGSAGLVLLVELLNSALEAAVDRIGTEPHELSGIAKDLGSAAVFASLAIAALTWLLVAADRFLG